MLWLFLNVKAVLPTASSLDRRFSGGLDSWQQNLKHSNRVRMPSRTPAAAATHFRPTDFTAIGFGLPASRHYSTSWEAARTTHHDASRCSSVLKASGPHSRDSRQTYLTRLCSSRHPFKTTSSLSLGCTPSSTLCLPPGYPTKQAAFHLSIQAPFAPSASTITEVTVSMYPFLCVFSVVRRHPGRALSVLTTSSTST
jgi:hypothetical protein